MHWVFRGWMCLSLLAFSLGCGDTSSKPETSTDGSNKAKPAKAPQNPGPPKKVPKGWAYHFLSVAASAYQWTLETIHDGTGWLLGKAEISIEQVGELRPVGENEFVADFAINVKTNNEAFSVLIKEVPCSEMAIPSADSQAKFNEAVGEIKAMLEKLQH